MAEHPTVSQGQYPEARHRIISDNGPQFIAKDFKEFIRISASGGERRRALQHVRLNSAIGYITPKDMLAGRQQESHAERDRKLEAARQQRQIRRQQAA